MILKAGTYVNVKRFGNYKYSGRIVAPMFGRNGYMYYKVQPMGTLSINECREEMPHNVETAVDYYVANENIKASESVI